MDTTYVQAPQNAAQSQSPMPPRPGNYLILAIFTTICCCLPFGVVGIVYASKVNNLYNMQQYQAAAEASNTAKKWSIIGIACGAVIYIIYGILLALGVVAGIADSY